ncbi:ABC transporter [Rhodopseudomonas sp. WA056]|nr:ABC transporter [Rhodopseudomonas sp. WA056]
MRTTFQRVMAGLVPAIHVFLPDAPEGVDARDKPGHNGGCYLVAGL